MKVVYRCPALQDRGEIADDYEAYSASTALRVLADIDEVVELLTQQPESDHMIASNILRNISQTYRCSVFPRIEHDVVAIVTIFKGRDRKPEDL